METAREITSASGTGLRVEVKKKDNNIDVTLLVKGEERCVLHWGLCRRKGAPWQTPPENAWPEASAEVKGALQTPFVIRDSEGSLLIRLEEPLRYPLLVFALYFPDRGSWDNNQGKNYYIDLPLRSVTAPAEALREWTHEKSATRYDLDGEGQLALSILKKEDIFQISLVTDLPGPLLLHWGVGERSAAEWSLPPESTRPEGTKVFNGSAAQTPFESHEETNRLRIVFREEDAPLGISFVLKQTETGRWYKNKGRNFFLRIKREGEGEKSSLSPGLDSIADEIVRAETGKHSWTLMHRFNLCHDLLDTVGTDTGGLALLFVWLRFSAVRQLDWQRNYNTKPRELSHAQDRLTARLAGVFMDAGADRKAGELVRLMMSSLGRGGEGQRIRDEILNIMHRHHIKEVTGHFLEEWHQKLHNNTTPDDPVICEAYIEFLRNDGDLGAFYGTLEKEGVTRDRLESFERPIVTPPDFVPHLKDALIHDFDEFLRILRSVHSGTDLESALNASRHLLDGELRELMETIWQRKDVSGTTAAVVAGDIVAARQMLGSRLSGETDQGHARDLIFLDLALEDFFRVVVERNIQSFSRDEELATLTGLALENLRCSYDDTEFTLCARWWEKLKGSPPSGRNWALHTKAATERMSRAVGTYIDGYYGMFQPVAEALGNSFHAEKWSITLFTEELVRGRPAFALSHVLRYLDPVLRRKAELGSWQVISPGRATGRVEVVKDLRTVQGRKFKEMTIIVADRVKGDEEPPEGVTAVITQDTTDIVSHVAVRARNARLLFATCYDSSCFEKLKALKGSALTLSVHPSGDVMYEEAGEAELKEKERKKFRLNPLPLPEFASYAVSLKDFSRSTVGGKSLNTKTLMEQREKFPEWLGFPPSAAIPFGVFEHVLGSRPNREIAARHDEIMHGIDENAEERLSELRTALLDLKAPEQLLPSLRRAMEEEGIEWPEEPDAIWACIKRVWASKWNYRAYLSRRALGIADEDIYMAVLVQQAVDAEYAFVLHTVNPLTGNRDELFAEVVTGLGETLVGNYPGRSLSFTARKGAPGITLTAYPSKSTAIRGGGLIFRSDSNGEDLAGFAGAGLYESVMLRSPVESAVDYSEEPLVWDERLRSRILGRIAEAGLFVEGIFNTPQDIEGVYGGETLHIVQSRPQVGVDAG